jgi:hypothetical protein
MIPDCSHTADVGTWSAVARIHSDSPSTTDTTSVRNNRSRLTRRLRSLAGGAGVGISESAGDGPNRSRLRVRGLVNGSGSVIRAEYSDPASSPGEAVSPGCYRPA